MIGTIAFILFWVVVALALFFIALSGGPRAARERMHSQSSRARRIAFGGFGLLFVGVGVVVPALVIAGTHSSQVNERRTFETTCGVCHTLAAAGATATVGPNLDQLLACPPGPAQDLRRCHQAALMRVQNAIRIGGTGDGRMPAGLLTGAQADQMAQFVSSVAGRRS
jgi:mono/diheme cytochrome c family protein